MSSSSSSYPPVVPQHCLSVPVLYELLKGEEEESRIWLHSEMNQIPDPLIDSLFHGLIMSSSAVPQSHLTVSELCQQLDGEKVEVKRVFGNEMNRLVDTLFERLTNKLRTNEHWHRSEDAGDRAQVGNLLDQVESHNAQSHQPSSHIAQPSTSSLNHVAHNNQQPSNGDELELNTAEIIEIKEEVEDGEEIRVIDIETLTEDNQSGAGESRSEETNQQMDCVKLEIKEEFDSDEEIEIKQEDEDETTNKEVKLEIKEEENEDGVTQITDIEGLAEDNQSGDDDGSVENAPMDWVKQEIKVEEEDGEMLDLKEEEEEEDGEMLDIKKEEEEEDGEMLDIKKEEEEEDGEMLDIKKEEEEEEGETNEDSDNEGAPEADEVNRMSMNNLNGLAATDIDTLFDRSMRDEVELGEPERSYLELITSDQTQNRYMSNASTISYEQSNLNLTNLVDQEVNNNIQHQYDETNNTSEMIEQEDADGETDLIDRNNTLNEPNSVTRVTESGDLFSPSTSTGQDSNRTMNNEQATVHTQHNHNKRKQTQVKRTGKRAKVTVQDGEGEGGEDAEGGEDGEDIAIEDREEAKVKVLYLNCTELKCSVKLDSLNDLHNHLRTVHQLLPLQCFAMNCNSRFNESSQIQTHIKQQHPQNTQFLCPVCPKEFDSQNKTYVHWYLNQLNGQFQCNFVSDCAEVTDTRNKMRTHQQTKHHLKHLHCTQVGCAASFSFQKDLKRHELTHVNTQPFHCIWPRCSIRTNRRSSLVRHIRMQHFGLPQSVKDQKAKNIVDQRDPNEYVRVVPNE